MPELSKLIQLTVCVLACADWPLVTPVPEQHIGDVRVAVGIGYGESKFISERILQIAAEQTPLRSVAVRVGQLSPPGDGAWDEDSWLPIQLASSVYLGALPCGYTVSISCMPSAYYF